MGHQGLNRKQNRKHPEIIHSIKSCADLYLLPYQLEASYKQELFDNGYHVPSRCVG